MGDQLERIEKYLRGDLSSEERTAFESEMENDPTIKEKVEQHRQLLRGLEIGFNRELKLAFQKEELLEQVPITTKSRKLYYPIGIAAAIALLVSAIFILNRNTTSATELFVAYYKPYANIESPTSRSESNEQSPYAFYENGDYQRAVTLFEKLIKENPLDPAPIFYLGICQLEMDKTESAASYLERLQKLDKNKYTTPALWYQGLSFLKLQNKQKAIDIFNELSSGSDVYANKSAEILEKLK